MKRTTSTAKPTLTPKGSAQNRLHLISSFEGNARAFAPVGPNTVWCSEGTGIIMRHLTTGETQGRVPSFEGHATAILHMQDDNIDVALVGYSTGTIRVFSVGGDKLLKELIKHGAAVTRFVYTGGRVFSASVDWKIHVWNPKKWTWQDTLDGHTNAVKDLTFNEVNLFSAGDDKTIRVWPLERAEGGEAGNQTWTGHTKGIQRLLICRARTEVLWSASDDLTVKLWDTSSGACLMTLPKLPAPVRGLLDLGTTAIASCGDGTMRSWFVESFKPASSELREAQGVIKDMVQVSTRLVRRLWTGHVDGQIRVWLDEEEYHDEADGNVNIEERIGVAPVPLDDAAAAMKADNVRLRFRLAKFDREIEALREQLGNELVAKEGRKDLEQKLAAAEERATKAEAQLSETLNASTRCSQQMQALEEKAKKDGDGNKSAMERIAVELADEREKCRQLDVQLTRAQEKLDIAQRGASLLNDLQRDVTKKESEVAVLTSRLNALNEELQDATIRADVEARKAEEARLQCRQARDDLAAAQERIGTMELEFQGQVEAFRADAERDCSDRNALREELEALRQSHLKHYKDENVRLFGEAESLQAELAELRLEAERLSMEMDEHEPPAVSPGRRGSDADAYRVENEQVRDQLRDIRSEVHDLRRATVEHLSQTHQKDWDATELYQKENDHCRFEIMQLQKEIAALEAERAEAKNAMQRVAELEGARREAEALREELNSVKAANSQQLQCEVDVLTQRNSELGSDLELQIERCSDLEAEVAELRSQLADTKVLFEESDQKTQLLQEQLRESETECERMQQQCELLLAANDGGEVARLMEGNEALTVETERLQHLNSDLDNTVANLQAQLSDATAKAQADFEEIERLTTEVSLTEGLRRENEALQSEVAVLRSSTTPDTKIAQYENENESLRNELEAARLVAAELENNVEVLTQNVRSQEGVLQRLFEDVEGYVPSEADLMAWTRPHGAPTYHALSVRVSELTNASCNMESTMHEKAEVQAAYESIRVEAEDLRRRVRQDALTIASSQEANVTLAEECDGLRGEISELRSMLQTTIAPVSREFIDDTDLQFLLFEESNVRASNIIAEARARTALALSARSQGTSVLMHEATKEAHLRKVTEAQVEAVREQQHNTSLEPELVDRPVHHQVEILTRLNTEKSATLQLQMEDMLEKDKLLQIQNALLAEMRTMTKEHLISIEEKEVVIANLQDQVEDLEARLNEETPTRPDEREEAGGDQRSNGDDAELSDLKRLLEEKQRTLDIQKQIIEARDTAVAELEADLDDVDAEMAVLHQLSEAQTKQIASLEEKVEEKDAELLHKQHELSDAEERVATMIAEMGEMQNVLSRLETTISEHTPNTPVAVAAPAMPTEPDQKCAAQPIALDLDDGKPTVRSRRSAPPAPTTNVTAPEGPALSSFKRADASSLDVAPEISGLAIQSCVEEAPQEDESSELTLQIDVLRTELLDKNDEVARVRSQLAEQQAALEDAKAQRDADRSRHEAAVRQLENVIASDLKEMKDKLKQAPAPAAAETNSSEEEVQRLSAALASKNVELLELRAALARQHGAEEEVRRLERKLSDSLAKGSDDKTGDMLRLSEDKNAKLKIALEKEQSLRCESEEMYTAQVAELSNEVVALRMHHAAGSGALNAETERLVEKLRAKETDVVAMKKTIISFEGKDQECMRWEAECKHRALERDMAAAEVRELKKSLAELQRRCDQKDDIIADAARRPPVSDPNLAEQTRAVSSLLEQVKSRDMELRDVRAALDRRNDEFERLKLSMQETDRMVDDMMRQDAELRNNEESRVKELIAIIEAKEAEIARLSEQRAIDVAPQPVSKLESEEDARALNEARRKLEALSTQLSVAQAELAISQEMQQRSSPHDQKKIKELQSELAQQKGTIADLGNKLAEAMQHTEWAEKKVQKMADDVTRLKSRLTKTEEALSEAEAELAGYGSELAGTVDPPERKLEKFRREASMLDQLVSIKDDELLDMSREVDALRHALDLTTKELEMANAETSNERTRCARLSAENAALVSDLTILRKTMQTFKRTSPNEEDSAQEEIASLIAAKDRQLEQVRADAQEYAERAATATEGYHRLEATLQHLNREREEDAATQSNKLREAERVARERERALTAQIEDLEDELVHHKKVAEKHKQALRRMEQELEEATQRVHSARARGQSIDAMTREHEATKARLAEAEKMSRSLQNALADMEQELDEANRRLAEAQDRSARGRHEDNARLHAQMEEHQSVARRLELEKEKFKTQVFQLSAQVKQLQHELKNQPVRSSSAEQPPVVVQMAAPQEPVPCAKCPVLELEVERLTLIIQEHEVTIGHQQQDKALLKEENDRLTRHEISSAS
eukprot:PhM_4_TR19138/c1_g1_i2/m.40519